eukprot:ANDGO_05016.mRNA.1 Coatomer subunit beta'-1
MKLDVKRKFLSRSERVKAIDVHPTEPWMLVAMYNGVVHLWNYVTAQLHRTFEVSTLPIRAAKFIPRKQWFVVGSDDLMVRVFHYNTMEKVVEFQAHQDYLRSIAVHPTLPLILTASDDTTVAQWNWDQGWKCTAVYEGHSHFVMQVTLNPKDPSTFATASLDRTIKVWGIGTTRPYQTLEGHEKGVNCVEYYPGSDKPYLVSGGDDRQVRVWDYQAKSCVQTLDAHSHNVTFVSFHHDLPIIISGSEDGSVKIWNSQTYRLEKTLDYALERAWCLSMFRSSRKIAIGFDEGSVILRLAKQVPVASLDLLSGKCILVNQLEVSQVQIKGITGVADGERLSLSGKDLGTCETPPRFIKHDPQGRFVAALFGDNDWVVYTAIAWRSKTFGQGSHFAWSSAASGSFGVLRSGSIITYRNFEEDTASSFRPSGTVEGLFGGPLLGVRLTDAVLFYDWTRPGTLVRRIDVVPKKVVWNDQGTHVALVCDSSTYLLRYNREAVSTYLAETPAAPDTGIEESFELLDEISDKIRDGQFVESLFMSLNKSGKLQIWSPKGSITICVCDRFASFWLGFVPKEDRVLLMDKERAVTSYRIPSALLDVVQRVVVAEADVSAIADLRSRLSGLAEFSSILAPFLKSLGLLDLALEFTSDLELRFELAIELGKLDLAVEIADRTTSDVKYRSVADLAISKSDFVLAETCLLRGSDLGGLLLLYTTSNDVAKLTTLCDLAISKRVYNVAFTAAFVMGSLDRCLAILIDQDRVPEACLFARTYCPLKVPELLSQWKSFLGGENASIHARALADPVEYPNMFPGWSEVMATAQNGDAGANAESPLSDTVEHSEEAADGGSVGESASTQSAPSAPALVDALPSPVGNSPASIASSPTRGAHSPASVPHQVAMASPAQAAPSTAARAFFSAAVASSPAAPLSASAAPVAREAATDPKVEDEDEFMEEDDQWGDS